MVTMSPGSGDTPVEAAATTPTPEAVPPHPRVYAVKFLCGVLNEEGPVEAGKYTTAINVHNPNRHPVAILKKAILLFSSTQTEPGREKPASPAKPIEVDLRPDWAFEIDCPDIREVLLAGPPGLATSSFIKGWVVIDSLSGAPLDVVAVYTARGVEAAGQSGPVSIAIDRVPGTQVLAS